MTAAFIIGLLGSLHCLGMCGPLVLAMPFGNRGWKANLSMLVYHGGRLSSYAILGFIFGSIGAALDLIFLQQWISIIAGALMLTWVISRYVLPFKNQYANNFMNRKIQHWFGKAAAIHNFNGKYLLGALNGFLPCGLVYLAAISGIAMASAGKGAVYMLIFGLGTLPALIALSMGKGWLTKRFSFSANKIIPAVATFMAIIFILRGLALDIPYISPKIELAGNAEIKSCCVKQEELPPDIAYEEDK